MAWWRRVLVDDLSASVAESSWWLLHRLWKPTRRLLRHSDRLLWRDLTAASGLENLGEEDRTLVAAAGAVRARLDRGGVDGQIRLVVEGQSGITLRAEAATSDLERSVGRGEVLIGDDGFDAEVYVQGRLEVLHAVLDAPTRRLARDFLVGRVVVGERGTSEIHAATAVLNGDVVAVFPPGLGGVLLRHEAFRALPGMLNLARRLAPPASLLKAIADSLTKEPNWQVRYERVGLLAAAPNPAAGEALRTACGDPNPDVRARAAIALGVDGRATLLGLVAEDDLFDAPAGRAVEALGAALPVERVSAILANALRRRFTDTAHACIAALGARGGAGAVAQLAKILAIEASPLAVSAARALGVSGAAEAEEPLVRALGNQDPLIAIAAAGALGQLGSARSVPSLKDVAAASGGELRRAARHAIVAIQSRLGGASPGQISLAAGDTGGLSLADEDPRGRLSTPGDGSPLLTNPTRPEGA